MRNEVLEQYEELESTSTRKLDAVGEGEIIML